MAVGLTPTFIGEQARMVSPPVAVAAEFMFGKRFSLGGYAAHSVTESYPKLFVDGVPGQWRHNYTEAGARFGVHVTSIPNTDIYGGLNIGVRHNKIEDMLEGMEQLNKWKGIEPVNTSFAFGGYVGGRYAFTNCLTAFGEVGTGASLIKVGVGFTLVKSKAVKAAQKRAAAREARMQSKK